MATQKLQPSRAAAVEASDTINIPNPGSAEVPNEGCVLYIGIGGDVKVLTVAGDEIIFVGVLGGSFLPIQVVRVFDTFTTADKIIALW